MRISADKHDRGHYEFISRLSQGLNVIIMLDGAVIQDVVTADDEAGFVEFYPRNEAGEFYPDASGEAITRERKSGAVTFVFTQRQ